MCFVTQLPTLVYRAHGPTTPCPPPRLDRAVQHCRPVDLSFHQPHPRLAAEPGPPVRYALPDLAAFPGLVVGRVFVFSFFFVPLRQIESYE